jgi:S1-C subfamily serine protease
MNDSGSPAGGGARQASPAVLLTLVLAVALLAGAISGTAVVLLYDSDSDSSAQDSSDTAAPAETPPALTTGFAGDAISQVAARALPSVVAIINEFQAQEDLGLDAGTAGGAGVVVDDRGFILTNAHLVQIPGDLYVLLPNGEVRPGQLVSYDAPFTDVAVIQIEQGGLTPIDIGDSAELVPGQTVVAIGSPDIDYYNSVSAGVVSAVGRRKRLANVWLEDLIQTDAAINVGNSGGPLLNLDGEMVGLNTFRDLGADDPLFGISFAISSRVFAPIAQSMIENGVFPRPYLGVDFEDITPDVADEMDLGDTQGTLIQSVTAGGPADVAGMQVGDIVTKFGDIPLSSQFGLLNALGVTAPDAALSLEVLRDGQPMTLDVQLEPR